MEISVYGAAGCPRMAMVTEFISAGGSMVKQIDIEHNPISSTVLGRLLAFESDFELKPAEILTPDLNDNKHSNALGLGSDTGSDTETLRQLLQNRPSALAIPLAVRGSRVVVASSPARIQSLMY